MAKTTYEAERDKALKMLMDENTPQNQLVKLYMGEIDRRTHSRRKEFTPLLDNAEVDILYRSLPPSSRNKIGTMVKRRNNVMRAATELEHIKLLIHDRLSLILSLFNKWEQMEAMEAAVNMALLAVPQPARADRARQIANRVDIYGCTQTVDDDGLLRMSFRDASIEADLQERLEAARESIPEMLASYKGCHQATMDYIKDNKLYMPVSMVIFGEYEKEVAEYSNIYAWDKYRMQPMVNLQGKPPTLQGLYGMAVEYKAVPMDKGGYEYMYATYYKD